MIAMVTGKDGIPATLHRTYLTADGRKADVESPRRLMPGTIPSGSAVRLFEAGSTLGIAEGIETALAASSLFGIPVWAAVNATMLAKWGPPPEARDIIVFGDAGPGFVGQAAAYSLARRLADEDRTVTVRLPHRSAPTGTTFFKTGRRSKHEQAEQAAAPSGTTVAPGRA